MVALIGSLDGFFVWGCKCWIGTKIFCKSKWVNLVSENFLLENFGNDKILIRE
jgi:hypothetical protein